jgi:hypothetical protein
MPFRYASPGDDLIERSNGLARALGGGDRFRPVMSGRTGAASKVEEAEVIGLEASDPLAPIAGAASNPAGSAGVSPDDARLPRPKRGPA